MNKWHVNPKTGKVGRCVAKIRCRFWTTHFNSKEEALNNIDTITKLTKDWNDNKEIYNKIAKEWLDKQNLEYKIIWKKFLSGVNTEGVELGHINEKRKTIYFSEEMKYIPKSEQSETIVHELAHINIENSYNKTKNKYDYHGESWLNNYIKIKDDPILKKLNPSEEPSEVYVLKIREKQKMIDAYKRLPGKKYLFTCSVDKSHQNFSKDKLNINYCKNCFAKGTWEEFE